MVSQTTPRPSANGEVSEGYQTFRINQNDATWILTSSFIIFTMQTGFSLVHASLARRKNQVSIMVQTTFNSIVSGLTYWFIGYSLSDPDAIHASSFIGVGSFLVDSLEPGMGQLFASYVYRVSTMLTATNVVLGAMAERINFKAFLWFLVPITLIFALPNYWVLSPTGFLFKLGVVDIAGCSYIHMSGGIAGLVGTIFLKPRKGRFSYPLEKFQMADPTNALLGTYMLWWGWVGFHMSSTFGVSHNRWIYCTRAAVGTIVASSIGGISAIILSYYVYEKQINIKLFLCGLFSGLVSVSGGCTLYDSAQAIIVGFIGSICTVLMIPLLKYYKVDDPVHAISIHLGGSIWGMIAVGLFAQKDHMFSPKFAGFFHSAKVNLLGAQIVAILVIMLWTALCTYSILYLFGKISPLRIDDHMESTGMDVHLNKITLDFDSDKLLAFNDNPMASASISARIENRKRLHKVTNAIIAVNRLLRHGSNSNPFRTQVKEQNTKIVAQSWSIIREVQPTNSSASDIATLQAHGGGTLAVTQHVQPQHYQQQQPTAVQQHYQQTTQYTRGTLLRPQYRPPHP